jgi:outer membrane receptor protein involved in Fe transport
MTPHAFRQSLLGLTGVSLIALMAAAPVAAQTASTPAAATDEAAAPEGQEIVITGTRIRSADFQTANPVVSINADRIQQTGETNLTQYLQRLPALVGSFGPTQQE